MKKVLPAAALAAALFSLTVPTSPATAEVRVFACEPEWAALAEAVGGADAVVYSATHGRQDPHYIRARPSLIAQIRRADILVCAGAELEVGWLPVLMQRGASQELQPGQPGHMMAADHVQILDRPETIDRSLGDVHPSGNPHVHLDPRNVRSLAGELARRLERIDPDNAEGYRSRLADFQAAWDAATDGWRARAEGLRGLPVVVYHEAWSYFLYWSGIEMVATLEALPGIPPSASHLQRVLERTRASGAKAILVAPYEPADASEWLAEKTGVPILELPFTVGGQPGVDDLFSLFEVTLTLLEGIDDRP